MAPCTRLSVVVALAFAAGTAAAACDKSTKPMADSPTSPSPAASSPSTPMPMPSTPETSKLAKSSNALGVDLYAKVRSSPGNIAMSPASISAALAMTFGGAKATTAAQMSKVMHLEAGEPDALMSDWGALSRGLQSPSRVLKLRIANRLFGEKTAAFDANYIQKTKTAFDAPLEPVDFKVGFEPARVHINQWVEDQTEKRIEDLLPPRALDALTRLVLVNAIYFLADWAEPFEKTATYDQGFTLSGGAKKKTPMMHRGGSMSVKQGDGVTSLELPYQGNDASMFVIVPDQVDGLPAVEKSLDAAKLDAWTHGLTTQRVSLSLPRFEVSPESMSLGKLLEQLGMTDAFDRDKADFTGIANPTDPRERLHIDKVIHKAFVKVDEKGTEAAAATAVVMAAGGAAPAKMLEVRADHPFLFVIVDRASGAVLFLGRVADPSTK